MAPRFIVAALSCAVVVAGFIAGISPIPNERDFGLVRVLAEEFEAAQERETVRRNVLILNATVRVEVAGGGSGSGTVIGKRHILTNHHVINSVIPAGEVTRCKDKQGKDRALCDLGESLKELQRALLAASTSVTVRSWIAESGKLYPVTFQAKVVAFDEKRDLALLEIEGEWPGMIAPIAQSAGLPPGASVWVAGSPLGKRPHITSGEVSLPLDDEDVSGFRHMMATTPVAPGNSGGGLWWGNPQTGHYELVAVTRALALMQIGFGVSALPHMSYFIPIEEVKAFLAKSGVAI